MNETILQYWNNVKQYWNKFNKSQKITFIATVSLLILTIGIVTYNMSKTEYALAYTDLQPSDAAAIKKYLTDSKIPYQLSTDGKSIGVPRNQVAAVKLDVESQGINKNGSIGYGAFRDNKSFGMTDNEFKIKHLDAIQGELQQLINSNNAVSSSKVLITLPDPSVFAVGKEKEQASASVVVQMKQGYTLDQHKIDTLYSLVSKSVKDLPADNITISDQNGDLLPYSKTLGATVNSASIATQQFDIKKRFEQDIRKNVKEILGGVLGPGKVIPMVVATMNFDNKKSRQQLVTPVNTVDQKGIEISLQEINKSYSNDGGSANGGVPGTGTTDVPTYPGSTNSGKSNSEEVQRTVNYEVNRITNEIESSPFVVTDLAISVGIEPPDKNDPNSLTQQTKDAIQQILVNVVSASLANSGKTYTDAELAKKVTVFDHSFAISSTSNQNNNTNLYLYGGLGVLALVIAAAAIGYIVSRRRNKAEAKAAELAAAASTQIELPSIDFENSSNDNQVRKQLESLAKKKPTEFVDLLRTWLVDE